MTAHHAGLSYVTDGFAGIRRRKAGKGWTFLAPDGTRVTDPAERKRILGLVIPPAWTDVWICPDPAGHIQVTARDAKGRKQYRYHPDFLKVRDATKYGHVLEFAHALPAIRRRVKRDMERRVQRCDVPIRRQLSVSAIENLLQLCQIAIAAPRRPTRNTTSGWRRT